MAQPVLKSDILAMKSQPAKGLIMKSLNADNVVGANPKYWRNRAEEARESAALLHRFRCRCSPLRGGCILGSTHLIRLNSRPRFCPSTRHRIFKSTQLGGLHPSFSGGHWEEGRLLEDSAANIRRVATAKISINQLE